MTRTDYVSFGRPNFSELEIEAVTRVLRRGWVGMGPETIAFEEELAAAVGARHVVTVNSCTSALFLSLLVSGVRPGDEVICPSLTWCSSANAVLYLGARPVFCDVDARTLCATPEHVVPLVSDRTRAVVVVHFGGLAAEVAALRDALPARVRIIEDAAHAFGATYSDGTAVGASGNPVCFSFYANKNLSTAEGGAVALMDDADAERIRRLRQHALPLDAWKRFSDPQSLMLSNALAELGYKMNYTDLQSALGRVQLMRQSEFRDIRLRIWLCGIPPRPPSVHRSPTGRGDERDARRDGRRAPCKERWRVNSLRAPSHNASLHRQRVATWPAHHRNAGPRDHDAADKREYDCRGRGLCRRGILCGDERRRHLMTDRASGKYGFRDRLKAEFPSQVIIDATEVCNLACTHCPHPDFKKSVHYGGRNLDPELNAKLVDEVREHGRGFTQYIRYTGEGEPLIHPHGYQMVEYAARHSGVFVTLTTNGTIMDERRTQRLLDSGVHLIDVSIDALTPETYARIRVKGDLAVTRRNVLRLIEWVRSSESATKVVVSFIEQPDNAHEAADFERFWRDAGAHEVVIRRLHSGAGAVVRIGDLLRGATAGRERYPCLYPWERIILNPEGHLAFCPQDWVRGSVIGDFRTQTIREIWNGPQYDRLRRAHLSNDFSDHVFCGQCPDWQATRWPADGLSYADMVAGFSRQQ
jgi:dTDP-4-amino-4,6-dideoxygalactose transaminase/MoaA/NifB/PqqE/SkfB family radical SAM enzyme